MSSAASDSSRVWNKAPVAAVALYLLCAVLLGFPGPGMNNDEAVFFNGAVQMVNSGQEPTFAHDAQASHHATERSFSWTSCGSQHRSATRPSSNRLMRNLMRMAAAGERSPAFSV